MQQVIVRDTVVYQYFCHAFSSAVGTSTSASSDFQRVSSHSVHSVLPATSESHLHGILGGAAGPMLHGEKLHTFQQSEQPG